MTQTSDPTNAAAAIAITRTFDAPRERVWRAWTEPERLTQWWGPHDQDVPVCRVDLRVGGRFLICMRSKNGDDEAWTTGVYQQIDAPGLLVNTISFADSDGNRVHPSQIGLEGDWPDEGLVTVTFEDAGGKTIVTLNMVGIPAGIFSEMTRAGWLESLEKLEALLGA